MTEEAEYRQLFLSTAGSYLDPRTALKLRPLPRDMAWVIVQCLNKVRAAMGQVPVTIGLTDLFTGLEPDIQESQLQPADLFFLSRYGQIQGVAVVWQIAPVLKVLSIVENRVVAMDAYRQYVRVGSRVHFRATAKWFGRTQIDMQQPAWSSFEFPKTYYLTKGNNSQLIGSILDSQGYTPVTNPASAGLIWTQVVKQVEWQGIREGKQLFNHVPGLSLIFTTKKSFRSMTKQIPNFPTPLSYDLSDQYDYVTFLTASHAAGTKWILKPLAMNQGIGISMVSNVVQFRRNLQSGVESRRKVIQLYIANPLLLEGNKFDIRYYVLIVRCKPVVVLRYTDYYIRRSLNPYSLESENLLTHLTNAHQQKSHPDFESMKEESIWSKQRLEQSLGSAVVADIERSIVTTLGKLIPCVVPKMDQRLGSFELLGVDFMLDSSLRLYMLEANTNPALYTDTAELQRIIPRLLTDTLSVVGRVHSGYQDYLSDTNYQLLFP